MFFLNWTYVPNAQGNLGIFVPMIMSKTPLSETQLQKIQEDAGMRFTISEIALMLEIPVEEFRRRVNDPDDELAKAYTRGKLETERKYREKLQKLAEGGNAWAIRILESKTIKQQEEELGLHG